MPRAEPSRWMKPATPVLLAMALAALGLVYVAATVELETTPLEADVAAPRKAPIVAGTVESRLAQPADAALLTQTLRRPLFNADRRPNVPAAAPAAAVGAPQKLEASAPDAMTLRLIGIIGIPGQKTRAVIRPVDGGESRTVAIGETMGAWRLVEIAADRVVVEARQKQRHTLTLFDAVTAPKSTASP